ncbi:MAG: addiction module protein [Ginsengibacter sp.]
MPEITYHIRIKKNYADDIIKDLQKMDAVELLQNPPIPDWQKKEVRKRLKDMRKNPSKAVNWNEAVKKIKQPIG